MKGKEEVNSPSTFSLFQTVVFLFMLWKVSEVFLSAQMLELHRADI